MPWNFGKIREVCEEKNLTYPNLYLLSLSWQHWKAGYHAQRAEEIWVEFNQSIPVVMHMEGAADRGGKPTIPQQLKLKQLCRPSMQRPTLLGRSLIR